MTGHALKTDHLQFCLISTPIQHQVSHRLTFSRQTHQFQQQISLPGTKAEHEAKDKWMMMQSGG